MDYIHPDMAAAFKWIRSILMSLRHFFIQISIDSNFTDRRNNGNCYNILSANRNKLMQINLQTYICGIKCQVWKIKLDNFGGRDPPKLRSTIIKKIGDFILAY